MSDSTKAALVASIAAGYLLGRSGKAKLALTVASYLASNKLRAKPQELLAMGAGRLGESPQLSQLTDQVRTELLSVGREALKAVADRRLGAFADSLAERTKSLSSAMDAVAEEVEEESEEEEEEEEPAGESKTGEAEEEPEEEGDDDRPKRRARSDSSHREPAGRSAPARKPAKKAPPKKDARQPAKTAKKSPAEQSRRRR